MNRRQILASIGASVWAGGAMGFDLTVDKTGWTHWKDRFLTPDGRIVDHLQNDASHSEGQGYALLLAQAFGDREVFERVERWTQDNLAIRSDALMAWRWGPEQPHVPTLDTATDGDLFRAWALLRAEVFSGWAGHGQKAAQIAAAITAHCLAPDPRAPDEVVLVPTANMPRDEAGLLFNPSYIMPRALRELGAAFGQTALLRAADHGETLLTELALQGMVPDWTLITPKGFAPSPDHSPQHGYDALRVALYLLWSGQGKHAAVQQKKAVFGAAAPTPVVMTRDGVVRETSDLAGYKTLRNLILCGDEPIGNDPLEPYYPAALGLLATVARRESGFCNV